MNVRFIMLIFSIVLVTACTPPKEQSQDWEITQRIRWANVTAFEKQGFTYRGGSNPREPTLYKLEDHYSTTKYQLTSLTEARNLFYTFFKEYIKPFNNTPDIRPYLHEYPLTEQNVSLEITFRNKEGKRLTAPNICSISNKDGYIIYMIKDNEETPPRELHKEPFTTGATK